ncbi:hypothetical protein [Actinomadura litoris]|uniref:hypothetical protein n=1 Tax=Actinomadura litoris TaxID=2678616 RepID=UPI001FA7D459|nr:hypothetical protein [Actinomadura litoris]
MTSDQNNDQAIDHVLAEYWAMYQRAQHEQSRLRNEALPLQRDHQKRTRDLDVLRRNLAAIGRDIASQEAMLRTVAVQLGKLDREADLARRKAEMHAAHIETIVRDTGRPHPKEADRRPSEDPSQPPPTPGQTQAGPAAVESPTTQREPETADTNHSGTFARLRSALPSPNGSRQ